jgi:hypothetical protein
MVSGLWRSAYSAKAHQQAAAGRTGRMFGCLALLILVATTRLDEQATAGILVTEREIVVRQRRRAHETRTYALDEFPDMVLNQQTIEVWLSALVAWGWIVVAVGLTLWLWIAKLFQVLFWSLLGLAVNAISGRSLRYGAIVNIGILALTVSLAMYLSYYTWGILVQPKPTETAVSPPAMTG